VIIGARTIRSFRHITDEIKSRIIKGAGDATVALVEIARFLLLASIRIPAFPGSDSANCRVELAPSARCSCTFTLVPYIATAGENQKDKPTQHSARELRSIGLQPGFD